MSLKWWIVLIVLFIAAGAVVLWYFFQNKKKSPKTLTSESTSDVEILFFYTDWCPYCKTAKPEWNKVKEELDGTKLKSYNLIFKDINCTNENKENSALMTTYKIEGYPTIKLIKNNEVIDYDAKPNSETLKQFIESVV